MYNNKLYIKDLELISNEINIKDISNAKILVAGASGLIGSFLVDLLMFCNEKYSSNTRIYALGRDYTNLKIRFKTHFGKKYFHIIEHDINHQLKYNVNFDFIIHAAGNAYPKVFSEDPVGTILSSINGTYNLLSYAKEHGTNRFLYISTGEIYGQGDTYNTGFKETDSGYVDITNPRACYPSGKRAAETLCISFMKQYNLDVVIARPCHVYGPTATSKDNRVTAQFVNSAINSNIIIMKSKGLQLRSYCYVADCSSAIMKILFYGETGNPYNIENPNSRVTIREIAEIIKSITGSKIIFDLPSKEEAGSFNPVSKSILNANKLMDLGWNAHYDIKHGIENTIKIYQSIMK